MKRIISFIIIILLLCTWVPCYAEAETIDDVLMLFRNIMDEGILDWAASLFEPVSGGFWFSQSAKENPDKYAPTIECINWAKDGLRGCGVIKDDSSIPAIVKEKFTAFLKERRGKDGYFYDFYVPERRLFTEASDLKRGRDLTAARSVLAFCGTLGEISSRDTALTDMYLLSSGISSKNLSDIESEEEFRQWLKVKYPFTTNPYQDSSTLAANKSYIVSKGWGDTMTAYLVEKQKDDGLWGDERTENWAKNNRINAALKNCTWFQKEKTPYPKIDETVESVRYAFENYEMPATLCESWNRLELIRCALLSQNTVPAELQSKIDNNLLSMLKACLSEIKKFKTADGGFSMYKNGGTGMSMGFGVCEAGKKEGDMNAFAIIRDYIRTAHLLAGKGEPVFADDANAKYFWNKILLKTSDYKKTIFYQKDKIVSEISPGKLSAKTSVYTTVGYENKFDMFVGVFDENKLLEIKVASKSVYGGQMDEVVTENVNIPSSIGEDAFVLVVVLQNMMPFGKDERIYFNGNADLLSFSPKEKNTISIPKEPLFYEKNEQSNTF